MSDTLIPGKNGTDPSFSNIPQGSIIPPQITVLVLSSVVLLVSILLVLQIIVTCLRRYCLGRSDRKLLKQPQKNKLSRSLSAIASAFGAEVSKRMRRANTNFMEMDPSSSFSSSVETVESVDSQIPITNDSPIKQDDSDHGDKNRFSLKMTGMNKLFKRLPTLHRDESFSSKIFVVMADNEVNKTD